MTWPDGERFAKCVVSALDAESTSDAELITLENSRIRGLALNVPMIGAGESIPVVAINGLPPGIEGAFGFFEIRVQSGLVSGRRLIPEIAPAYRGYVYFVLADGRIIIVEPDMHKVVYILVA
ncbi:hypothetical protein [Mesorhizobium sp. CN2-181]|uniref:hypothetical protein n=1 Tax=Mesorhizobium yinganensis TaxID=3157707 RepID=UPI0032B73DF1